METLSEARLVSSGFSREAAGDISRAAAANRAAAGDNDETPGDRISAATDLRVAAALGLQTAPSGFDPASFMLAVEREYWRTVRAVLHEIDDVDVLSMEAESDPAPEPSAPPPPAGLLARCSRAVFGRAESPAEYIRAVVGVLEPVLLAAAIVVLFAHREPPSRAYGVYRRVGIEADYNDSVVYTDF